MWSDYTKSALQQNVLLVTKISEEIVFVAKNTPLVTKHKFRRYCDLKNGRLWRETLAQLQLIYSDEIFRR